MTALPLAITIAALAISAAATLAALKFFDQLW